ncbi:MAG: glycerol-3-phosphate 1-O-acyltransferase PlsY [Cyanobacteria bacterium J06642_9]
MVGLAIAVCLFSAYLLGSIPTGYVVAKTVKGIDIRQHGSGSTGTTNVLRTVGKAAALAVLIIDLIKGAAAARLTAVAYPAFVGQWANSPINVETQLPWLMTVAGLLALIGHSKSVWINFKGGKSAASGLGVLLAIAWPIGLGVMAIFATVVLVSRIVSLGSMVAAISVMLLMALTRQPLPYLLLAIAGGGYVLLRHRSNIERILAGTEPHLGDAAKTALVQPVPPASNPDHHNAPS